MLPITPFTTRVPLAGMMVYENVRIQLVDIPPIHPELTEPWVYAILRNANVLWLVIDVSSDDLLQDLGNGPSRLWIGLAYGQ
jgi:ribosome-interacting GTPase 1